MWFFRLRVVEVTVWIGNKEKISKGVLWQLVLLAISTEKNSLISFMDWGQSLISTTWIAQKQTKKQTLYMFLSSVELIYFQHKCRHQYTLWSQQVNFHTYLSSAEFHTSCTLQLPWHPSFGPESFRAQVQQASMPCSITHEGSLRSTCLPMVSVGQLPPSKFSSNLGQRRVAEWGQPVCEKQACVYMKGGLTNKSDPFWTAEQFMVRLAPCSQLAGRVFKHP